MVPILRPTKIRYYVNAMSARGFLATDVLADSGISEQLLPDPALLVDSKQCDTVVSNMLRLTDNPALGFEIGGGAQLADFGILAHAMMSSPTLGQAMALWVRFYNLVGLTVQLRLEENGPFRTTICDTLNTRDPIRRFYVEELAMLGIRLGEGLTGKPYIFQECTFAYPPPPHAALYGELLRSPVSFNAPQNRFVKKSPMIDAALRGSDPEFNEICLRHCSQIMRQIASDSPIVAQLRSLFLGRPSNIPSLDEAAHNLGVSARSLRRHLLGEGTSYQALIDAFRLDLAKEYLKSEHLMPKEIGYLLGFRSTPAFSRAFKSWTGKTIQQYRDGN
jgi:AraC-like DNA-binding protein